MCTSTYSRNFAKKQTFWPPLMGNFNQKRYINMRNYIQQRSTGVWVFSSKCWSVETHCNYEYKTSKDNLLSIPSNISLYLHLHHHLSVSVPPSSSLCICASIIISLYLHLHRRLSECPPPSLSLYICASIIISLYLHLHQHLSVSASQSICQLTLFRN